MSTVKLCDRCGKRMPADRAMAGGRVITAEPGECFDLCNRCYVKFKEFMQGRELKPPLGSLSVVLVPGDHVKDPPLVRTPVRDDGEGGPAGAPAPTRETAARDTSSVGSADTFPSRGRLDGEAKT